MSSDGLRQHQSPQDGQEEPLERRAEQGLDCWPFQWYPLGPELYVESTGKLLETLLGFIHMQ